MSVYLVFFFCELLGFCFLEPDASPVHTASEPNGDGVASPAFPRGWREGPSQGSSPSALLT